MFAFELIYIRFRANLCLQFSIGMAWGGPLFDSDSKKGQGGTTEPPFKSPPRPLLKLCLRPLKRYGTRQEIINMRPEQMYTSSDTELEWPRDGPLYKLVSNKRQEVQTAATIQVIFGPLLKSGLGPCSDMTPTRL